MENHKIDAPDDVPHHVDHRPQPIRHTEDNQHDVFDVAKHLGQYEEGPQSHLANKAHDDDAAHFTTNPNFAKSGQQDPPKHSSRLAGAMREVHENVPKNVSKTGKTGAAKEAMLDAIAYSKSGEK